MRDGKEISSDIYIYMYLVQHREIENNANTSSQSAQMAIITSHLRLGLRAIKNYTGLRECVCVWFRG